jgi:trk/ktr system potassium uptake protein
LADRQALVIGLGRFGGAVARELQALGVDVLGVDLDGARVRECMADVGRVVEADGADEAALRDLGAADSDLAVVAIGEGVEASILATHGLLELGVPRVVARANTASHAEILSRLGAHRVIFAERDMGVRVAHLALGRLIEYLPLDDDFALVETEVPHSLVGSTLAEAGIRARHGVTVVSVKPAGGGFTHALPETVLGEGDIVVAAGPPEAVQAFASLS